MTQQAILNQYSKHAPHVQEMIDPMLSVGIAGIYYVRIYSDGSIINLANNAYWTDFYYKQLETGQYQHQHIADQLFTYSGVSLWALNEANPIWQDAKQYFGYHNGVMICENQANFRETIGFYSAEDDSIMNHFYVNQIDTLKKMKRYFTVQAHELIQQAEEERQLYQHSLLPPFELESESTVQPLDANPFQKSMCLIHKQTLQPIQLSPQRSKCLSYLMTGISAREIAVKMNLSAKTVEHYIEFLRKSLGCRTSKDLILSYANQV